MVWPPATSGRLRLRGCSVRGRIARVVGGKHLGGRSDKRRKSSRHYIMSCVVDIFGILATEPKVRRRSSWIGSTLTRGARQCGGAPRPVRAASGTACTQIPVPDGRRKSHSDFYPPTVLAPVAETRHRPHPRNAPPPGALRSRLSLDTKGSGEHASHLAEKRVGELCQQHRSRRDRAPGG